jgi:hypothetical protein
MGSVSRIVPPASLRAFLIDAVERGMRRAAGRAGKDGDAQSADLLPR